MCSEFARCGVNGEGHAKAGSGVLCFFAARPVARRGSCDKPPTKLKLAELLAGHDLR